MRVLACAAAVRSGIFRSGVSLSNFCRLFYLDNPAIVANKRKRWADFLSAARNGRLLERPRVDPLWKPHKVYHSQIEDALQSSYKDVEKELREMTKYAREQGVSVLFVAGDGLALMRLNHLLAAKQDQFIDQTPVVIPIQGVRDSPGALGLGLVYMRARARAHSCTRAHTLYRIQHIYTR